MNDSAKQAFVVSSIRTGPSLIVTVEGELDLASAASFRSAIVRAIQSDAQRIVIDLAQLTFVDSRGVSAILEADRTSRRDGNRVEFRGASGQVARLFAMTGIRETLEG